MSIIITTTIMHRIVLTTTIMHRMRMLYDSKVSGEPPPLRKRKYVRYPNTSPRVQKYRPDTKKIK